MTLTSVRLPTTVVGSYPVVKGSGGVRALMDPLKHAVEVAVADQIAPGSTSSPTARSGAT